MIEVKNVEKGYGKETVIKGISFTVQDGSIHGLIGENSAGKTTLIKTMVGIYKADAGEILYDGKAVYDNPEVKCRIGYVADSNEYIPGHTVGGMVRFFEGMYPTFERQYFQELNEIFKLPIFKSVDSLSKGQKMRLAFMLNMAWHPDYMIMDEPTSGIDPEAKQELLKLLVNEVEERGMTVLISSHHLGELEAICDGVTMIKEGEVLVSDEVLAAKDRYAKVQIVFKNGQPKGFSEWDEIVEYSNVGSIYTAIVRDYNDKLHRRLLDSGADLVETLSISLEELFLCMNRERGD